MKRKIFKLLKSLNYFSKSFSEVRRVLGENFISPAEVVKVTRLFYTKEQFKKLRKKLPSKKILKELKENDFFLIPVPPRAFCLKTLSFYFPYFLKNRQIWEKDSFFKNEKIDTDSWIAVSKDFGQKQKEDLKVVEVLWLIIILKLTRSINFIDNIFISTSSKTSTRIVPKGISIGLMPIDGLVLAVDDCSKNIKFFKFK